MPATASPHQAVGCGTVGAQRPTGIPSGPACAANVVAVGDGIKQPAQTVLRGSEAVLAGRGPTAVLLWRRRSRRDFASTGRRRRVSGRRDSR
jgi:hypothetical protein